MGQDLFKYVPSEILLNILLRLPTRSTMSCKCVCKPWLNLIETHEFVKSHLSLSAPCLVIYKNGEYPKSYEAFEVVDKPKSRARNWNMILNFNLPFNVPLYSSVDGLLFLCIRGMASRDINYYENIMWPRDLFICNPLISEYIKLPCPPESSSSDPQVQIDTFGFGLSKITGRYKLVRIFHDWIEEPVMDIGPSKCQVYTVGTGSWSRIASAGPHKYEGDGKGVFLNGNLHWMVTDFVGSSDWVSCFDVETECFSTFNTPPCHEHCQVWCTVSSLKGCLCWCDITADEALIFLMKEYGVESSWTKTFVISKTHCAYYGLIWPLEAFKNGDILLAVEFYGPKYYSRRTKSFRDIDLFGVKEDDGIHVVTYTPSFVPLRNYAREAVISF